MSVSSNYFKPSTHVFISDPVPLDGFFDFPANGSNLLPRKDSAAILKRLLLRENNTECHTRIPGYCHFTE